MTLSITIVCHYAECHYAECRVLFIVMLSVVAPFLSYTFTLSISLKLKRVDNFTSPMFSRQKLKFRFGKSIDIIYKEASARLEILKAIKIGLEQAPFFIFFLI
jgi:hypothetical protein